MLLLPRGHSEPHTHHQLCTHTSVCVFTLAPHVSLLPWRSSKGQTEVPEVKGTWAQARTRGLGPRLLCLSSPATPVGRTKEGCLPTPSSIEASCLSWHHLTSRPCSGWAHGPHASSEVSKWQPQGSTFRLALHKWKQEGGLSRQHFPRATLGFS